MTSESPLIAGAMKAFSLADLHRDRLEKMETVEATRWIVQEVRKKGGKVSINTARRSLQEANVNTIDGRLVKKQREDRTARLCRAIEKVLSELEKTIECHPIGIASGARDEIRTLGNLKPTANDE